MNSRLIGFIIFILIVALGIGMYALGIFGGQIQVVKGFVGGEKIGFLEDEEVQKILKNKYKLEIDYTKAGSIEMVRSDVSGMDFLWPSSQVALEIFKKENSNHIIKSERILNSPIVLYSWTDIADSLIDEGIVHMEDNLYYVADFPKLIGYVVQDKQWADIGLPDIYQSMKIISTDPNESNSGNMFSGLLANILNNGSVVDLDSVEDVIPIEKKVFSKLGMMESSSGTLFDKYLSLGMGVSPIIVGYENQIIEFALEDPGRWEIVKGKVALMYPEPTVWSEHPMIALNENGKNLLDALLDNEIQKIAWEKHGFRSGLLSVKQDSNNVIATPEDITKVMAMPTAEVMQRIMDALLEQ